MEEQTIKVFTLEEANKVLPVISKTIEEAQVISGRIKSLKMDMDNLMSIWGKEVLEKGHVDNEFYNERIVTRQQAQSELADRVEEIQKFGCVVKDVETGLVDFFYDKNGTLVFLCWRNGEKRVEHWHPIDAGFASRMPVD
jgi:hypothetical protein